MAKSPLDDADGPVGVTVKSDGTEIPETMSVLSVRARNELGRIPEAILTIATGSIAENEFDDVDGTLFKVGAEIEISAFYGSNAAVTIFKGLVYAKRLKIAFGAGPQMILTLRDKAQKMNVVPANGQYLAQKDSDIMSAVIGDAGLSADVTATAPTARDQMRHNCTDWDFLRMLADRNGHILFVEDGTIKSAEPDTAASAPLTLTLGVDIISFDAAEDTQFLIEEAEGTSWDDATQEAVTGASGPPPALDWGSTTMSDMVAVPGNAKHAFSTNAHHEQDELKAFSKARLSRAAFSAKRGRVSFQGCGDLKPNNVIELSGLGEAFGGKAYVSGVIHDIEAGEWTTEANLGLPEDWRSDDGTLGGAAASGIATPVHGLQIGKVVKLLEDEDERLRIQIKLPVHGAEEILIWARYAAPYATPAAGVFFLPEVDDEVVVGYLDSDPDNPVILGSLHNGTAAQPYEPDEENTYKAIVTNAQLKIEFEDAKKIITISTPGGHTVTMDDDAVEITLVDTTGNEVKMTSAGIDMTSPGDINISADGNISIAATGDASVEGMNVNLTAQTQLTAEGSAGAELSSGGQTVVKGSIVMIN
jgi:Rhs element Vgr protein